MNGKPERVLLGNGVSPGIALGQALKLDSHNRVILKLLVSDNRLEDEVRRLEQAIQAAKKQLEALKSSLEKKVGPEHSFILDAHLLMLEDGSLISEIKQVIRSHRANAEWALQKAAARIQDAYASLEDKFFRERRTDIEDVVERVLLNLSGDAPFSWASLPHDLIVVSHDFNPSIFAVMDLEKVRGLALEAGGRTSHTAILSRSLRLPAVMEIREALSSIHSGDVLLLDGDEGLLVVNPSAERLDAIRGRLEEFVALGEPAASPAGTTTSTPDGRQVSLRANTDLPHEVRAAKQCGAAGIGLFRSEFLFFGYPHGLPGMEAQLQTYCMLAREMAPYPVTIRTLDCSAEKLLARSETAPDANPSMGLRGIRLSLMNRGMFKSQIEAILRASHCGRMEIILPMVTTAEEVREAKALIEEVRSSIPPSSEPAVGGVPVGAMIEVPAAVLTLEELARELDFVCVGTNDLTQYLLAVDRGNPKVSHLFQPLHPSMLLCLRRIADICAHMGKPVRICGEMASNPFFAVLLIGMGFFDLSLNSFSIPMVRKVLQGVSEQAARDIAAHALSLRAAPEIGEYLIHAVTPLVRMDLSPYVREVQAPHGRASVAYAP